MSMYSISERGTHRMWLVVFHESTAFIAESPIHLNMKKHPIIHLDAYLKIIRDFSIFRLC